MTQSNFLPWVLIVSSADVALGRLRSTPEGRLKLLLTTLSDITDDSLLDELTGDSW